MTSMQRSGLIATLWAALGVVLAACEPGLAPTATAPPSREIQAALQRDPDVPDLPFPDNPDPAQCGIPVQWGKDDPAWLDGHYEGTLVQPKVFLYDSHLRGSVTGAAPSGTPVRIILYQRNPTLDYYRVETISLDSPQDGWVPAPFLRFDPPQ
jgi:hypothetical protein